MDSQRWQQVAELFEAAVEQAPGEREQFLRAACARDPQLRQDVESLLAAHDRDPAFLEDPGDLALDAALAARTAPRLDDSRVGSRIGAWLLARRLSPGLLGAAYACESDGHPRVGATLTLLDSCFDAAAVLQRSQATGPLLAALQHAGIARLLDAGRLAEGQVYLVTERAEGIAIDQYCRQHALGLRDRVALLLRACEAVHAAHQHGVVHGALRAMCVRVAEGGALTVEDLGRVPVLGRPLGAGSAATLGLGSDHLLTEYTAPEQLRGGPATTLCDVHALGILMFLLLADTLPYVFTNRSAAEIARMSAQAAIPRPSAVASARQRALAGDLDAIVLRATQRDPARRYPSVDALATDLRSHLRGLPVAARPLRAYDRAGRAVRRHPLPAGLGGLALATGIALALLGARQVGRATEERRRALDQQRIAQDSMEALIELFQQDAVTSGELGDATGPRADTATVRALLERGERAADAMATQPELQARRWRLLAELHAARGDRARAAALLRKVLAYRQASVGRNGPEIEAIQRALQQLGPPETDAR